MKLDFNKKTIIKGIKQSIKNLFILYIIGILSMISVEFIGWSCSIICAILLVIITNIINACKENIDNK